MPLTNNDISTAITTASTVATNGFTTYQNNRKKGQVCEGILNNIGLLFAYKKALTGYDVNNYEDYCYDLYEVQRIINGINETADLVRGCN